MIDVNNCLLFVQSENNYNNLKYNHLQKCILTHTLKFILVSGVGALSLKAMHLPDTQKWMLTARGKTYPTFDNMMLRMKGVEYGKVSFVTDRSFVT
jgi:hypothetical protein